MLYIFAGFPRSGLHAGGLQRCIETVEDLGILVHDPAVQVRKEGVFASGSDELLYPVEVVLSPTLERDGIGWDWFPENWFFGNGVTIHKTTAEYRKRIVVLRDNRLGVVLSDRRAYERRWMDGKCPEESHVVQLTWCVFQHELPDFAVDRLRALIEDGAEPLDPSQYDDPLEAGKYKSEARELKFEGQP